MLFKNSLKYVGKRICFKDEQAIRKALFIKARIPALACKFLKHIHIKFVNLGEILKKEKICKI